MPILGLLALLLLAGSALADVRNCACDTAKPETLQERACSLCKEVEKHPAGEPILFLKDINPRKPNRWLALPRAHVNTGPHDLSEMPAEERTRLWTAAISKGRELWGGGWGLAVNGNENRTQCHTHIHIGKLLEGIETANFVVVDSPPQIPAPKDGGGMWVHPEGNKLHVHLGEQITETVLLR